MTTRSVPRIAVDAQGGDYGPSVVVPGVVQAARQLAGRAHIVCVGDEGVVRAELEERGARDLDLEIVHAPQNIEMDEAPAAAIRRKPESSIVVGARLMKEGVVDAFVSAGSTGAVTAASTLIVGRLPGVARPGIATMLPTQRGIGLVLDVGANSDCKAQHLLQFGAMGRIYAEHVLRIDRPTVGLLNIGEESGKGSELTKDAYQLLSAHEPAFVGNVEGKHVFEGKASVIVTDGFVGNVVLKILESFGSFLLDGLREQVRGDVRASAGAWLLKPAVKQFSRRFDYAEYGGAPLLGCRGVIIICHGSSNQQAIANAVRAAERGVRDRVPERIAEEIERERREIEAERESGEAATGLDSAPDRAEGSGEIHKGA